MIEEKLQKNEHVLTPTILKNMGAEAHTVHLSIRGPCRAKQQNHKNFEWPLTNLKGDGNYGIHISIKFYLLNKIMYLGNLRLTKSS